MKLLVLVDWDVIVEDSLELPLLPLLPLVELDELVEQGVQFPG